MLCGTHGHRWESSLLAGEYSFGEAELSLFCMNLS